jgi:TRAP transporter TAXI family solute receptor
MGRCIVMVCLLATLGIGRAAPILGAAAANGVVVAMDPAPQGPFGIAAKRPVFGGACKVCPWGAVAEIVRDAMKPYGYEVQICYHCARADAPRIVAGAKKPPPWRTGLLPGIILDSDIPPPPDAPVDFGATSVQNLRWAYDGSHQYAGEGPRKNLRLIANIQAPNWLIVAVRQDGGVTDLAQLRDRSQPVHILTDENVAPEVLAWYGISKESVQAKGGWIKSGTDPANRKDFDVVIYGGSLGNAPEFNLWYEISQRFDLDYLQLPDTLLDQLARDDDMQRQDIPDGLLRGIHRRIPTVARTGHVVYTRDDVPDSFAYAVAKALDEQQRLFQWSHINLSYNVRSVASAFDVPLHPGAAKYYRERGYLPASASTRGVHCTL